MQIEFDGTQYDSKEEVMFSHYVRELLERGWLTNAIYQPRPFLLARERCIRVATTTKRTEKTVDIKLAREHIYTADWHLTWADKSDGVFTWMEGGIYPHGFFPYRKAHADKFIPFYSIDGVSIIDVKGETFGRNNSSAVTFPLNQKWLLTRRDMFVQKVVVSLKEKGIFARTFTPRRVITSEVYKKDYKKGDISAKAGDSKLKYTPTLIEHFEKKRVL